MRYILPLQSAIAGLLVVPAFTTQDQGSGIEAALTETVVGIEKLASLGERIADGDSAAVARLLQTTEPAAAPGPESDARLAELRETVSELRMLVDEQERGLGSLDQGPNAGGTAPLEALVGAAPTGPTAIGAGIAPETWQELSPLPHTSDVGVPRPLASSGSTPTRTKQEFETPGYVADAIQRGRLLFRMARYADALAALRGVEHTEAGYWRARCHEELDELGAAVSAFQSVIDAEDAGSLGLRAKRDLEFLEWKRLLLEQRGGSER